jgi:hypothetical protein
LYDSFRILLTKNINRQAVFNLPFGNTACCPEATTPGRVPLSRAVEGVEESASFFSPVSRWFYDYTLHWESTGCGIRWKRPFFFPAIQMIA